MNSINPNEGEAIGPELFRLLVAITMFVILSILVSKVRGSNNKRGGLYEVVNIFGRWEIIDFMLISLFYLLVFLVLPILMANDFSLDREIRLQILEAVLFSLSVSSGFIISHYITETLEERTLLVNPIRAIGLSLSSIFIIGLIKPNVSNVFLYEVRTSGPLVVGFITYNVFADTISLVETQWILKKSQTVSLPQLPLFLASDLILSAGIYILLPVAQGQHLTEFLQAIHFTGPRPWLGILFWSTFSTSVIFYLFVGTVVIVQLLLPISRLIKRLGEAIQFESHPTFFISIIASFIITAIFALVAVSRLIL